MGDFNERQNEINEVRYDDPMKASGMQWQLNDDRMNDAYQRQQAQSTDNIGRAGSPISGAGRAFPGTGVSQSSGNIIQELLHWKSLLVWAVVFGIIHYAGWANGVASGVTASKVFGLVAAAAFLTSRTLRQYMIGCALLCLFGFIGTSLLGGWLASHTSNKPAARPHKMTKPLGNHHHPASQMSVPSKAAHAPRSA